MSRFTRIKLGGLSDVRRMPRLGKIRLGVKVQKEGGRAYPKETDYFVFDDPNHVAKLGFEGKAEELKAIDVMLPSESIDECMPAALKSYKQSGLFCEGDGEQALRREKDGSWTERQCPCDLYTKDKPDCKEVAVFNVIVPKLSVGGVFQIVTSSKTSIIAVQSAIDYIRELVGRVKMVPLLLERVPTPITHTDPKTGTTRKQTHYTLRLTFPFDIDMINELKLETTKILSGPRFLLPAPDDLNPYKDPPDLIEGEDGELRQATATVVDAKPKTPAKPAKPAATKPAAKKPAAKPAPAAKTGPEVVTAERMKKFWMNVQRVIGKAMAKTFMQFFVKEFCQAKTSAEVTVDVFEPQEQVLASIMGTIQQDGWGDAGAAWWDDLQHQLKDDTSASA